MMRGEWLRRPESGVTVVFLHGVLSSTDTCWLHENGSSWPGLLRDEPNVAASGIYTFEYRTGLFSGTYRLGDAVDALKEQMRLDGLFECRTLIFVAHSMGGIVARKLVVERAEDFRSRDITVGLFLVASPSLGSRYANMLKLLAEVVNHTQADALRFSQTNSWLMDLDREFLNLKESGNVRIKGKELIEDRFIALPGLIRTQVVEPFSGARYFGEPLKVPGSDHFTIAKPESTGAIQHRLLARFVRELIDEGMLPLEKALYDALYLRLRTCREAGMPFRTFHRLAALLGLRSGFARECFDAAGMGTADKIDTWLRATIAGQPGKEQGLPAFEDPADDPVIFAAQTLALAERAVKIDERHLLLVLLSDDTTGTMVGMREGLGNTACAVILDAAKRCRPRLPASQFSQVASFKP
jgi:hypothetical protein